MAKTKILLVDDHAVLRRGMRDLIDGEADMEVIGELSDGSEVSTLAAQLHPDVIVMDLSMAPTSGTEATKQVKQANLNAKVLVLTVHEDRNYLREVLEAGAMGYMLKRAAPEELIDAIRAVANGSVFIDSRIATNFINVMISEKNGARSSEAPELTRREYDVLRNIAEGYSNKEIAALLDISVKTVETYKTRGMEKLGIKSRVEIVRLARDRNWPAAT